MTPDEPWQPRDEVAVAEEQSLLVESAACHLAVLRLSQEREIRFALAPQPVLAQA